MYLQIAVALHRKDDEGISAEDSSISLVQDGGFYQSSIFQAM